MSRETETPAAPVVLPEPAGYQVLRQEAPIVGSEIKINRLIYTKNEPTGIHEKLYTERQVRALLATGGQAQAGEQAPVLYVSEGQLDNHRDPDGPDSANAGRYLPARITPAGNFTMPLFAAPQAQADTRGADGNWSPTSLDETITLHIEQTAELLACCRVSQDGWAKVLERTVTDLHDLAAALQSGKIVAHVPTHLTGVALAAATGCEASAGLIRSGIAGAGSDAIY